MVEELFVNVASYAYKDKNDGKCKISIEYNKEKQEVKLSMEDNGIKIIPSSQADFFNVSVLTTKNEYDKTLELLDEIVNRAIGSALRDYSKSNHEWVLENVVMNSEKMNKKTKQEAIKWIDSKGLIK